MCKSAGQQTASSQGNLAREYDVCIIPLRVAQFTTHSNLPSTHLSKEPHDRYLQRSLLPLHIRYRIAFSITRAWSQQSISPHPFASNINTNIIQIGVHTVGQYGFRGLRIDMHELTFTAMLSCRPHYDDGGLNWY